MLVVTPRDRGRADRRAARRRAQVPGERRRSGRAAPTDRRARRDRPRRRRAGCARARHLRLRRRHDRRRARGGGRRGGGVARHRRDRPAVAVALRVPGHAEGARRDRDRLLVQRARRPGRHDDQPRRSTRPTSSTAGSSPRSAARWRRCPGRSSRPRSAPTRRACTRASRRSSRAPPTRRCGPGCGSSRSTSTSSTSPTSPRTSAPPRRRSGGRRGRGVRGGGGRMTPPTIAERRPEVVTRGVPARRPAWIEAATSADHKVVAKLWMGTALTFLAVGAVLFALTRLQLIVPDSTIIKPEIFNRILSAASVTTVVLFAVPFLIGLIGVHRPAPDRRPRRRAAAAQPALLLALRGRRLHVLRELPLRGARDRARRRSRRSRTTSSRPRTGSTRGSAASASRRSGSSASRSA